MKSLIKKIARKIGIDLKKFSPEFSEIARFKTLLSFHKINLILDIGANSGQYGHFLREVGYQGKIISFEPLSSAHAMLLEASKNDCLWIVAPQIAIGDSNEIININIASNSFSSSILEMNEIHTKAAPNSEYIGTESVQIRKLDDFLDENKIPLTESTFLKIDTQGYEEKVLMGAKKVLEWIKGVQIELSIVSLYKNQLLFRDIIALLESNGFELWEIIPGFTDKKSGRMLQFDGIFFK